ncbi:MAG: hypothetical protein AAF081_04445 [Actinomycetota bacterium]
MVLERYVTLPGGVQVTVEPPQPGGDTTWSFPNLQGHNFVTTDEAGTATSGYAHYDPWGYRYNTTGVTNTSHDAQFGAFGSNGNKLTEPGDNPITHMGARPFSSKHARFLTVDPIHGGCANNYVYGYGDPINGADLNGKIFGWVKDKAGDAWNATGGRAVSWAGDNLCGIAEAASWVGAGLAFGALALGVAVAAGTAPAWAPAAAAAAAVGAAVAGSVQAVAGYAAGDNGHVAGGVLTFVGGGVSGGVWSAAGKSVEPVSRVAAGIGVGTGWGGIATAVNLPESAGGCS